MDQEAIRLDIKGMLVIAAILLLAALGIGGSIWAEALAQPGVGDIIEFGGFDFRVLDEKDGFILVVSEDVLGRKAFHDSPGEITWKESDLRRFLNEEFYDFFSEQEQARIQSTRLVAVDNPWFLTYGGGDSTDKIFLLSLEEVVQYFGDSGSLHEPEKAGNEPWGFHDAYSNARIAHDLDGKASWWWLRSSGEGERGHLSTHAAEIAENGFVRVNGAIAHYELGGVRPAMWLENAAR